MALLLRRLQAAEAAAAEATAQSSARGAGLRDAEARNSELLAQLQACQCDLDELTDCYRRATFLLLGSCLLGECFH